jgi:hypothetical protein
VPHFGFSTSACGLLMPGRVGIVGVHLYGQLIVGENEFDENRKLCAGSQACATPIRGHFVPSSAQCFALKRTCGYFAIDTGEPGLAEGLSEMGFLWEKWSEGTRAPEARAENRLNA